MNKLKKVVIITGAGNGIGLATTNNILSEFPNIKVIAIARNISKLKKISSKNLQIIQADLLVDMDKINKLIGKQKIDGLLNNAGILIKKPVENLRQKDFEIIYKTNVYVPFQLATSLLNNFTVNSHILNIGSMGGFQNTIKFPEMVFYSSSKAALHCMSQCLAVDFEPKKINVNCLSIGSVETEMVKQAFPGFKPPITAKTISKFISWFLIHGQNFMNGQIIPVQLKSV